MSGAAEEVVKEEGGVVFAKHGRQQGANVGYISVSKIHM